MQLAADQQPGVLDRLARSVGSGATVLVLLLIGEMMLSSRAVVLANWNEDLVALWPLAIGGVVLGVLLSLVRFPDLVSHLIGLFSGVALSLVYTTRYLDAPESTLTEKTRALGTLIVDWLRESMSGRQSRDDLVLVTAMGLLLWLIGYISAWFLFRRGWFLPAAVLPGIPIALNLGGIEDGMDAALLIYVLLALSLAAVQVARLRTAHWRQSGLAFSSIAWRAPAIGGAANCLTTMKVPSSPQQSPSRTQPATAIRTVGSRKEKNRIARSNTLPSETSPMRAA